MIVRWSKNILVFLSDTLWPTVRKPGYQTHSMPRGFNPQLFSTDSAEELQRPVHQEAAYQQLQHADQPRQDGRALPFLQPAAPQSPCQAPETTGAKAWEEEEPGTAACGRIHRAQVRLKETTLKFWLPGRSVSVNNYTVPNFLNWLHHKANKEIYRAKNEQTAASSLPLSLCEIQNGWVIN